MPGRETATQPLANAVAAVLSKYAVVGGLLGKTANLGPVAGPSNHGKMLVEQARVLGIVQMA